jgi:fructokinase
MILVIGEVLFDIFPDYRRLGGAPFNVAFHLRHFGLPVRFISRVGNDPAGEEIRRLIAEKGFRADDIQIDKDHPTGSVRVDLDDNGVPKFSITADVAYDHLELNPATVSALGDDIDMIYYGTLLQRTDSVHQMLQHLLNRKKPRSQCFYDINLRPNCYNAHVIRDSLQHADHVKLNQEELTTLKTMFGWSGAPAEIVHRLMEVYALETVSLTKGERGSELFTGSGHYTAPPADMVKVVDTVGAGDAYAAVMIAGFLQALPPAQILKAATQFAVRICEIEGAIPADHAVYDGIIDAGEHG